MPMAHGLLLLHGLHLQECQVPLLRLRLTISLRRRSIQKGLEIGGLGGPPLVPGAHGLLLLHITFEHIHGAETPPLCSPF